MNGYKLGALTARLVVYLMAGALLALPLMVASNVPYSKALGAVLIVGLVYWGVEKTRRLWT